MFRVHIHLMGDSSSSLSHRFMSSLQLKALNAQNILKKKHVLLK